jgi:beta-glucanase (GH16 family)
MTDQPMTYSQISRRRFLKSGALTMACLAGHGSPIAYAQRMAPMAKRNPTSAERDTVKNLHAKAANILFQDDFKNQATYENNWTVFTDNRSDLMACRTAKSLSVSSNGLAIETVPADHCHAKWSTGEIISKQAFTYGLYEAYIKIANATGVDNAFWLTTQGEVSDGSGDSFEIDISETYYPSLIRSTLHRHNLTKHIDLYETGYNDQERKNLASEFHEYGLLWTPTSLVFCLDSVPFQTFETKGTVKDPANLRLSIALGPQFGGAPPANPVGLTMQVKHVRVIGL